VKKRGIAIGVAIGAIVVIFILIYRSTTFSPQVEYYTEPLSKATILYHRAETLSQQGELLRAKTLYKRFLEQYPESNLVNEVKTKLDDVNMRILFSSIPTKDSTVYKVKPGDTLGKIARRFGTTVELIMKSNGLTDTLIRPGMPLKISKATFSILVDKSQNILMLKADDEVLKTYSVATGADNCTPTGTFTIINKLENPTWFKTGAVVPPESPENILGSRWMGLTIEGYGIHGTTDESSIGKQITAGCIRMKNKDVEELYAIIPVGAQVTIID